MTISCPLESEASSTLHEFSRTRGSSAPALVARGGEWWKEAAATRGCRHRVWPLLPIPGPGPGPLDCSQPVFACQGSDRSDAPCLGRASDEDVLQTKPVLTRPRCLLEPCAPVSEDSTRTWISLLLYLHHGNCLKMSTSENLRTELLSRTPPFGLRLWVVLGISIWAAILFVLGCICFLLIYWRKRRNRNHDEISEPEIPDVTKEIAVDQVGSRAFVDNFCAQESHTFSVKERHTEKDSGKMLAHSITSESSGDHKFIECISVQKYDRTQELYSGDEGISAYDKREFSHSAAMSMSPRTRLPEFSHLGLGHGFTLRDLEHATNGFSNEYIIGEGGYGVVYHGHLVNGTDVAIKKLFNNMGQAEKEFRVEVEAIGHVRHKNLVRLLGYCIEGTHRMLVYEYISNGNLDQWLHGSMRQQGVLTWEARIKITLGIAKALAYLHEGIEPKVIHRDIKSSNILIDEEFNGKLSDFGLSKLLGAGKSHITTRVMGTFGYVAPEYVNTGLLNEKSDVYSFGVLLLEAVTGKDPVNYSRPANEVHMVEWLKLMVGGRRAEEVVDPEMETKPTKQALKRSLLVALKCVDPVADRRPTMGQAVRMLEAEDVPSREDRRRSRMAQIDGGDT